MEPPAQKQFIGEAWVGRPLFLFDFHAIQPGCLYGEEGGSVRWSVAVPEGELCGLEGADFMTNGVLPGASCNINGFCSRLVAGGCKGRTGFPVDNVTRTAKMSPEVLMSARSSGNRLDRCVAQIKYMAISNSDECSSSSDRQLQVRGFSRAFVPKAGMLVMDFEKAVMTGDENILNFSGRDGTSSRLHQGQRGNADG